MPEADRLNGVPDQTPVDLPPDGRDRPPHSRTWRDGWRHLRFMLPSSPQFFLLCKWCGVAAVAILVAVLLVAQIIRNGWCNDESAHIPAGLYHLETGRMDAYRVNPPLPRMIAAIPLLIDRPRIGEWHSYESLRVRSEYLAGGRVPERLAIFGGQQCGLGTEHLSNGRMGSDAR